MKNMASSHKVIEKLVYTKYGQLVGLRVKAIVEIGIKQTGDSLMSICQLRKQLGITKVDKRHSPLRLHQVAYSPN